MKHLPRRLLDMKELDLEELELVSGGAVRIIEGTNGVPSWSPAEPNRWSNLPMSENIEDRRGEWQGGETPSWADAWFGRDGNGASFSHEENQQIHQQAEESYGSLQHSDAHAPEGNLSAAAGLNDIRSSGAVDGGLGNAPYPAASNAAPEWGASSWDESGFDGTSGGWDGGGWD